MRKIRSQEDIEKSQRLNKIVIGAILIFLMIFSTAGFALYGHGGGGSSNGNYDDSEDSQAQDFSYNGQYWVHNLGEQQYFFTNYIELSRNVPIEMTATLQTYAGSPIYVAAENEAVINEINQNIGRFSNRVQRVCHGACEEDLPEKECDENLIVWNEAEENRVYQQDNCVFIEGDLVAVDAFLYRILGLI